MTTIVYRNGVFAADGASFAGSLRQPGNVAKIVRCPGGFLAGACGSAAFCESWNAWASGGRAGEPPQPAPDDDKSGGDCGILIHPDGRLQQFEAFGVYFVEGDYYAIGAGDAVAMGAFFVGATAEQAIRAAIFHDSHTGGDPTILELDALAILAATEEKAA